MEDFGLLAIAIALVSALIAGIVFLRGRGKFGAPAGSTTETSADTLAVADGKPSELVRQIRFEEVPTLAEADRGRLVEIRDKGLLAVIGGAVPVALQGAAGAGAAAKLGEAVKGQEEAVKAAGTLYRAVIPQGAVLADSKALDGAKRGIFHGAKGIQGHADLVAVEQQALDPGVGKELVAANAVANAMDVASLVVGQYYMAQINGRLDSIDSSVEKISSFQDAEYRSKVNALVAAVRKSSAFSVETLSDEGVRQRELAYLKEREKDCMDLLGQASIMLEEISGRRSDDYDAYARAVAEADAWFQYQQVLLRVMAEIAELTFTLNGGAVTRENCYAMLPPYLRQAEGSLAKLEKWHGEAEARLGVDVEGGRRLRTGVEGVLFAVPGLFNDDLRYRGISSRVAGMISSQREGAGAVAPASERNLYQEDVTLLLSDGAVYYLPQAGGAEGD